MRKNFLKIGTLVALGLPAAVSAQVSYLRPFLDPVGAPSGPTINSVSVYTGVYSLGSPTNVVGEAASPVSVGTLFLGGATSDVGYYFSGPQTRAFVDYTLAYSGNSKLSALNGFDHTLIFGVQTALAPRVTLIFDGLGESSTFAGVLYEPTTSLSLAQTSGTADQLGGSPGSAVAGAGATTSPIALALYGDRRRDFAGGARVLFKKSSRTTFTVGGRFIRDLPASVNPAGVGTSIPYGGVSEAIGAATLAYSLSRRTEIDGEIDFARSYWPGRGAQTVSGLVGIGHNLSRLWFVRADAGYGGMTQSPSSLKIPFLGSVVGGGSLGAHIQDSSLVISASRMASDAYGLGAANTTTAQLAWAWRRPGSAWTVGASIAYERLAGTEFALISGWMGQATVSRQLSRQLTLVAQANYASDTGVAAGDFASLTRRGARLTLTWRPRGELPQSR
jgi:hypothetical protein